MYFRIYVTHFWRKYENNQYLYFSVTGGDIHVFDVLKTRLSAYCVAIEAVYSGTVTGRTSVLEAGVPFVTSIFFECS